jgi:hypothetical protein
MSADLSARADWIASLHPSPQLNSAMAEVSSDALPGKEKFIMFEPSHVGDPQCVDVTVLSNMGDFNSTLRFEFSVQRSVDCGHTLSKA